MMGNKIDEKELKSLVNKLKKENKCGSMTFLMSYEPPSQIKKLIEENLCTYKVIENSCVLTRDMIYIIPNYQIDLNPFKNPFDMPFI